MLIPAYEDARKREKRYFRRYNQTISPHKYAIRENDFLSQKIELA